MSDDEPTVLRVTRDGLRIFDVGWTEVTYWGTRLTDPKDRRQRRTTGSKASAGLAP